MNGEVHLGELNRGGILLDPKHTDIVRSTLMRLHEVTGLHKHAARPTAGVEKRVSRPSGDIQYRPGQLNRNRIAELKRLVFT